MEIMKGKLGDLQVSASRDDRLDQTIDQSSIVLADFPLVPQACNFCLTITFFLPRQKKMQYLSPIFNSILVLTIKGRAKFSFLYRHLCS